ncbi:MAG: hypothetical protein AB7O92_11375 [Acidimicrobiia bacterium]
MPDLSHEPASHYARELRGLGYRYDAFISYSGHVDLAAAIQRGLERLARPPFRLRALDVFRDARGLEAGPLAERLWDNLRRSRYLILLASPAAARSKWVDDEVRRFIAVSGCERVLIALVDGRIEWDGARGCFGAQTSALPPALLTAFPEEQLHVDFSWARDKPLGELDLDDSHFAEHIAQLAASVHPTFDAYDLQEEDRRLLRQRKRYRNVAVALLLALTIGISIATISAMRQRDLAQHRELLARSQQLASTAPLIARDEPRAALVLASNGASLNDNAVTRDGLLAVLGATGAPSAFEQLSSVAIWSGDTTADGAVTAFGDEQGLVTVLERTPAKSVHRVPTDPDGARALAISADGRRILVGGLGGSVYAVERRFDTWAVSASLALDSSVWAVDLSVDDASAAVSTSDGTVTILSPELSILHQLHIETAATTLQYNMRGELAWGSSDGAFGVISGAPPTATEMVPPAASTDSTVSIAAAADDVGWWVAWAQHGVELVGGPSTGLRLQLSSSAAVTRVAALSNEHVAVGSADGYVETFDGTTGRSSRPAVRGHTGRVQVLVSMGADYLSAGVDGLVVRWPVDAGASPLRTVLAAFNDATARGVAVSALGEIVVGRSDGTTMLWRPGTTRPTTMQPHSMNVGEVTGIAFSPDGLLLATAYKRGAIELRERGSPESPFFFRSTIDSGDAGLAGVTFGHGGAFVLAAGSGSTVRAFSVFEGMAPINVPTTTSDIIRAVAARRRDNLVLVGRRKGTVEAWALARSPELRWTIQAGVDVESLALAEGQDTFMIGGLDGSVQFRSARTGDLLAPPVLDQHSQAVRAISISDDGMIAASAGADEQVALWDLQTRSPYGTELRGHHGDVRSVAFYPDAGAIISAGYDGEVVRWDIDARYLSELACHISASGLAPTQIDVLDLGRWRDRLGCLQG